MQIKPPENIDDLILNKTAVIGKTSRRKPGTGPPATLQRGVLLGVTRGMLLVTAA